MNIRTQKIMDFVDNTLLTTSLQKATILNKLIDWSNNYEEKPVDSKITLLVNDILLVYFSNELAQSFLNMYFKNILVSNHKNKPLAEF
jgi:hypothetical protein